MSTHFMVIISELQTGMKPNITSNYKSNSKCNATSRCRYGVDNMKNVTISLSNDLVQVLDSLCENCNLSRYAFTKEALLEKIERYANNDSNNPQKEEPDRTVPSETKKESSVPPFFEFFK